MSGTIAIMPAPPKPERKKRVAAYARVSCGKDAMLHSLSAQVSHYSDFIRNHGDWIYAGVYVDEAKTGTKDSRENFRRLIADCRAGKIDTVITKSISRFARNTVTLLETVRMLKSIGVDVYFEEQGIHTIGGDGELMMTVLAGYAQEESKSVSDNMKWRIRRNFEEGKPWDGTLLGYRYKDGQYVIQPDEAETVRRIFELYLSGLGCASIAKALNAEGRKTRFGNQWGYSSVREIIRNDTYTGNLTLQKTFREDHISKRVLINNGEHPKYYAEETHEAIIPRETFDKVQAEIARRMAGRKPAPEHRAVYPFTGKLNCAICGKNYRRKSNARGPIWMCVTFNRYGKDACASKQIPEDTLLTVTANVLGLPDFDAAVFAEKVSGIQVCIGNKLIYRMTDGTEREAEWKDRSRSESWTAEMREAARQKALERSRHNA